MALSLIIKIPTNRLYSLELEWPRGNLVGSFPTQLMALNLLFSDDYEFVEVPKKPKKKVPKPKKGERILGTPGPGKSRVPVISLAQ